MLKRNSVIRRLGHGLVSLLFPPRCVICERVLFGSENRICDTCGKTLPRALERDAVCTSARQKGVDFAAAVVAPLYYEGEVREALLRYKFNGLYSYAPAFAQLLAQTVQNAVEAGEILAPQVVTFVPVSPKRRRKRGYDQAKLLAAEVAVLLGLPLVKTLEKVVETPAQSTLDEKERRGNVVGAYRARPKAAESVRERHILLIDDVLTTGATLSEAAKTAAYLLPGSITCATVAQTRPKHKKTVEIDNPMRYNIG